MTAAGSLAATVKAGAAATQATVGTIEADAEMKRAQAELLKAQAEALRGKTGLAKGPNTTGEENAGLPNKTTAGAAAASGNNPSPLQKGGFVQRGPSPTQPTDYLSLGVIGAVLAGGLLLGASRNVLQGKDDSPPNARRV
jgi:hypothetical protein